MKKQLKKKLIPAAKIEKLKDLEPDALPLPEAPEDILDEIPEEDDFYNPAEEKPVPGEGP
jgi:hypothetical protein